MEFRRPARGHLEPVEAAPGDSDHADLAGAPGLRSYPFHYFQAIVLLLLQIFILEQAVGFPRSALVDANAGIAMTGEIGMGQLIALRRAVAFAIGQIFQDRR